MTTIYVSPNGSNGNSGSKDSPLASLGAAHDGAHPTFEYDGSTTLYATDCVYTINR